MTELFAPTTLYLLAVAYALAASLRLVVLEAKHDHENEQERNAFGDGFERIRHRVLRNEGVRGEGPPPYRLGLDQQQRLRVADLVDFEERDVWKKAKVPNRAWHRTDVRFNAYHAVHLGALVAFAFALAGGHPWVALLPGALAGAAHGAARRTLFPVLLNVRRRKAGSRVGLRDGTWGHIAYYGTVAGGVAAWGLAAAAALLL
jgi:hypothetical protein